MWTCRARWGGSRACSRCGLMPARSSLQRALRGGPALGRAVKSIKEQMRAVPDHGLGYGLLRYLNARDARCSLRALRAPQIGFNYLGRFRRPGGGGLGGCCGGGGAGGGGDPAMPLAHCIEVNALTLDGADGASSDGALVVGGRAVDPRQEVAGSGAGLVCGAGGAGAPCRRSPVPAAARPCDLPLRGAVAGRDRAAGERVSAASRTSCRCRRCRRGCCSMRFTMRRAPDVYTVQLVLGLGGAARRGERCRRRRRLLVGAMRACGRALSMRA